MQIYIDQHDAKIWMDDFVNTSTPGGESMVQMNGRVTGFWQDLIQPIHQKVAVVTHGGVIRLLLAMERRVPLASAFAIKVDYGDVVIIRN